MKKERNLKKRENQNEDRLRILLIVVVVTQIVRKAAVIHAGTTKKVLIDKVITMIKKNQGTVIQKIIVSPKINVIGDLESDHTTKNLERIEKEIVSFIKSEMILIENSNIDVQDLVRCHRIKKTMKKDIIEKMIAVSGETVILKIT